MGDKSPKSKQKSQGQKDAVKKQDAANAKSKQATRAQSVPPKKK
jgi:hypothetical protein